MAGDINSLNLLVFLINKKVTTDAKVVLRSIALLIHIVVYCVHAHCLFVSDGSSQYTSKIMQTCDRGQVC